MTTMQRKAINRNNMLTNSQLPQSEMPAKKGSGSQIKTWKTKKSLKTAHNLARKAKKKKAIKFS